MFCLVVAGTRAGQVGAATGETLRGRVTDASGAVVAGAEVVILDLHRETRSGQDGAFEFSDLPSGVYTLSFYRLGYAMQSLEVIVPHEASLDVALKTMVFAVPTVQVTGARIPRPALDSPLPVAYLSGADLDRQTSVSLSHSLERRPGMRTLSTGAEIGKPMIRGLTGARILVLDNGHRMEDYSWSDEDGPSVDPAFAERVEVIRGPASVLYGSEALNGVANVIPPELPESEDGSGFVHGRTAAYFSTNNKEGGLQIDLEGARKKMGWRFGITGRKAEALHTPDGELENTGFGAVTGEAAVGVHGSSGNLSVRYARYGGEFKLLEAGGPPPGVEEGEEGGPERKAADDRVQVDGDLVAGDVRFEAKAQWQRHELIELSDEVLPVEGLRSLAAKKESEAFHLVLNSGSLDLLAHHYLGNHIKGTAGVSGLLQDNDSRGPIPLVPDATAQGAGVFVFEEGRWGRWSVLGGVRGDVRSLTAKANPALGIDTDDDRDWSAATGDAGLVFRLVDGWALTANAGAAWRPPTLFELYAEGPQIAEARYLRGDATLDTEHSFNLDGGIRCRTAAVRAEAAVYRNQVQNFIALYPTGESMLDLPVYDYRAGDALLTGAELGVDAEVGGPVRIRGEADYVRGEDEESDEPLPLIPPYRLQVGVELGWTDLGWAQVVRVGSDVSYTAEKTRLAPYETGTGDYALLGFHADVDPVFWGRVWNISFRVKNAGNLRYRDYLSRYRTFADNPGRDVNLRVGTSF